MSVLAWLKAEVVKLEAAAEPEIKAVENEAHVIITDAASYVKANALQDIEQLTITIVGAMLPGAPWAGVLAAIETQALAMGRQLVAGASDIVASKVKADLVAIGKLPASAPAAA